MDEENVIKPVNPLEGSDCHYWVTEEEEANLRKYMGCGIKEFIDNNMNVIHETHTMTIEDFKKLMEDLKR